jgi:methylase of polypeptide subunit release factors
MSTQTEDAVTTAARLLGEKVRSLGYTEDRIVDMLGEEAFDSGSDNVAVHERRVTDTRLGIAVRMLLLQLPVAEDEARRAVGRDGLEALAVTGLAEVGSQVTAHVRFFPLDDLLVASDDFPRDGSSEKRTDYVAAYTPTSRLLDSLTPRRRVGRALDVGTGSGVHALLAAQHAGHVVATDINPRALHYTELNAALNDLRNIECRQGSLFDPVDGETFDLVTCNAPYVVSPESRWTFRDGGREADQLSEQVVRAAAQHLNEGGFATMMVSWVATDPDEPDERAIEWIEDVDCDGWVLPAWGADPLEHAATWNDHLEQDEEKLTEALDSWTEYLNRLGIRWVSEGAVVLHRREGPAHGARVDSIDEETLEPASEQVIRAFEARGWLAGLQRSEELLAARLAIAVPVRAEQELEPDAGPALFADARIELTEGTHSTVETSPHALEVVASLDGETTLADVVESVAALRRLGTTDEVRLRRDAVRLCRELLELGALSFD